MNIHDIVNGVEWLEDHIGRNDERALDEILLEFGSQIDEDNWEKYKEAVKQWQTIKAYYWTLREDILKLQKWMEEMGYDEDIEDEE
jgi:hypothetical protein